MAEMKATGIEYDERMDELEKLEYPKPTASSSTSTFNAFARRAPLGRRRRTSGPSRSRGR